MVSALFAFDLFFQLTVIQLRWLFILAVGYRKQENIKYSAYKNLRLAKKIDETDLAILFPFLLHTSLDLVVRSIVLIFRCGALHVSLSLVFSPGPFLIFRLRSFFQSLL